MFDRVQKAIREWRAERLLLSSVPTQTKRDRQRSWAWQNASPEAKHRYQAACNQYAMATGRQFPIGDLPLQLQALSPSPTRRSDLFPVFSGLGHGRYPGLRALPKPAPMQLRRFSDTPPGRRAINKVKNNIARLDWKIVPRDETYYGKEGPRRNKQLPLEMQGRVDAATRAFSKPNQITPWNSFISEVTEDVLVGGFGSIEAREWEGNPLIPFRLWPVDGMSIRVNVDWLSDDDPNPNRAFRYSQALGYGGGGVSVADRILFPDRNLVYVKYNSRTCTPFGLGPLEVAFQMINAWLGSFEARERTESNEIPPFAFNLGEDVSPEQVEEFKYYWETWVEGMGKIPMIGGSKAPEILHLRQRQLGTALNAWPEIVLRMIAISFDLAPQTFGLERDVNRTTADVMNSEEFADAVLPVAAVLEENLTDGVLWKLLGWDDLRFEFIITQGDRNNEVELARNLWESDLAMLNEGREQAGLDPLPPDDERGKMFFTELRAKVTAAAAPEPTNETQPAPDRLAQEEQTTEPAGFDIEDDPGLDEKIAELADWVSSQSLDASGDRIMTVPIRDPKLAAIVAREIEAASLEQ